MTKKALQLNKSKPNGVRMRFRVMIYGIFRLFSSGRLLNDIMLFLARFGVPAIETRPQELPEKDR